MSIQKWWAASSLLVVGCGAGASTLPPAATVANVKRELIAQPCAELPGDQQAGHARVFIQAAQVVASELQEPLDAWLVEHPVGIAGVVSFMADKDAPTTVSWNRCLDEACAGSEPWQMAVTPALPASASGLVRLTVQLSREQGAVSGAQSATLETRSQKPVAIELAGAEAASWSLVVTPYLIGDDEDLRRLAACKSSAAGGSGAKLRSRPSRFFDELAIPPASPETGELMSDLVLLAREEALAIVTINRPDALNSLNQETLEALRHQLAELAKSDARAAILTGAGGRAFVAGADIAAMSKMTPAQALDFARLGQSAFAAIEALPMPVIAAVDGFALGGGCEIALACDFIYASDKLKIGQPEVKLGVVPGFGGTQRLARRVGLGMARELIYSGRQIGSAEALRIGLVNAVFPRAELMDAAKKTALEMAAMSPNALTLAKRAMNEGAGLPLTPAIELEAQAFSDCFAHPDQREGMTAFLDKRTAQFGKR